MKTFHLIAGAAAALVVIDLVKPRGAAYGQAELMKDIINALEANKPTTFGDARVSAEERVWCGSLPHPDEILKSMISEAGPLRGHPAWFCAEHSNDARCLALKSHKTCLHEQGVEFNSNLTPLGESVGNFLKTAFGGALQSVFGSVVWLALGAGIVYLVVKR